MKAFARTHLPAVLIFAALVFAALGPLDPFLQAWGGPTDDFYEHVNLLWWQAHEARSGHVFPLFSEYLAYPDGGKMFLPDPIGGTLSIPVVWLAGVPFAYNLLVFGEILFACWAMFFLVRRRTGDFWAALLAGVLYGLSPVMLGNLHNGITETLQAGWLPLFLAALLAQADDARNPVSVKRSAGLIVLTAVLWWLVTIGQWYFGLYACLLFMLVVFAKTIYPWNWRFLVTALVSAALYALLLLPVAHVFWKSFHDGGSLFYLGSMDYYIGEVKQLLANSVDPAYLFSARPGAGAYRHFGYLGFATVALLLVSLVRKRWRVFGWLAAAAFFMVMAFGPKLGWHCEPVLYEDRQVLLPYFYFYKLVPFFKQMRMPFRFILMAHLCLAMLIGVGTSGWLKQMKGRAWVFFAAIGLVFLETVSLSGVQFPAARQEIAVSPLVSAMGGDEDHFAVFDLPITFTSEARGKYLVGQTFHEHPIVYGIQGHDVEKTMRQSPLANALYLAGRLDTIFPDEPDLFHGLRYNMAMEMLPCLRGEIECSTDHLRWIENEKEHFYLLGITQFILHKQLLGADSRMHHVCKFLFGPPVKEDKHVAVFRLIKVGDSAQE